MLMYSLFTIDNIIAIGDINNFLWVEIPAI